MGKLKTVLDLPPRYTAFKNIEPKGLFLHSGRVMVKLGEYNNHANCLAPGSCTLHYLEDKTTVEPLPDGKLVIGGDSCS